MSKVSIRRFFKPTKAFHLALVLLVLASTSRFGGVTAQEEQVEQQQEEYQEPHPEDPVTPQKEEAPAVQEEQHEAPPVEEEAVQEEAVQEEPPPVEEEAPPVQEEEPPVEEQAPPVQEEEPPVVEEEAPPVVEEEEVPPEPPREESPPPIDDSLFELNVFECVAPRGDPAPKRSGPVPGNSIMTLCIRPKNEDEASLQSIDLLEFKGANRGPSQAAVKDNESAGPMTRAICPMQGDDKLCIAATKLDDDFFTKALPKVKALGEVVVAAAGETRTVPFEYKFSTAEAPKQEPMEHEFFEIPKTPKAFPCGPEIRIWLISALVLTLLEFAFSPDEEEDKKGKSGGSKKKKGKKD